MPIFTTTGTTGVRKSMELTPEQLKYRADNTPIAKGENITKCKVFYIALSQSTVRQRYIDWAAQTGGKSIAEPIPLVDILARFQAEKIDCMIAGPGYLKRIAMLFEEAKKRANLTHVISEHATMPAADALYIQKWLSGSVWVGYGTSEIGHIAGGLVKDIADVPGCVGKVLPGVTVEIDNGQIRIKQQYMVTAYIDDPIRTAEHFRDGWFYPGDTGHFLPDGRLVLIGRTK